MKKTILMTNKHLRVPGGSETWTHTIAKELSKRFNVDIATVCPGRFSDSFDFANIITKINDPHKYNFAFINHPLNFPEFKFLTCLSFIFCHGIIAQAETPVYGAKYYFGISEEITQKFGFKYLVRNPVDCKKFRPKRKINRIPQKVYFLSKHPIALKIVQRACKLARVSLIWNPRLEWKTEDVMNEADIVISLGRGCYEAMACGRNVIVFDGRPYFPSYGDGLVTPESIKNFRLYNCSGRYSKKLFTAEMLADEIKKYNPKLGAWGRKYALKEHDIKNFIPTIQEKIHDSRFDNALS